VVVVLVRCAWSLDEDWHLWAQCRTKVGAVDAAALAHSRNRPTATRQEAQLSPRDRAMRPSCQ